MQTVRYGKDYSERMSLIDAIYNTTVVRYSALEQQVEKQHRRCGSERRRCDVVLGVLLVELVVRWFAEHSRAAWWVRPRNSMYYPSMSDTANPRAGLTKVNFREWALASCPSRSRSGLDLRPWCIFRVRSDR